MSRGKIKEKILSSILIASFVLFSFGAPYGTHGVKKAQALFGAGDTVFEIGSVEGAINNAFNAVNTANLSADHFKEFVLDPLVWALINNIITNMLQELTRWVNSGFQGEPSFVTDLEGFLLNAIDETAGEFLSDQGLEFLCSPFRLDVKIALNITYQQARNETTANECRLTDMAGNIENFLQGTFSEGGWASWFDLTIEPTNDPNKAFLENRARLRIRLLDQYGRELTEVAAKDFFLDVKICEGQGLVVETPGRPAPSNCIVTTPGRVVEAQVNDALGLPRQRLAFADEFDELVGALLAQLANQVLMGVNGLLGLGGSDYAAPVYGPNGDQTYLEVLGEESRESVGGVQSILDAIDAEEYYRSLMLQIIDMIDEVEDELNAARTRHPSCFTVRMPSDLTDERDDAEANIISTATNLDILTDLFESYTAATTTEAQEEIINDFYEIQLDIITGTQTETIQAEIEIDYILPNDIDDLRTDINRNVSSCETAESR